MENKNRKKIIEDSFWLSMKPEFRVPGYWTGLEAIEESSTFFSGCKNVLDIGSGTGKFCLLSAVFNPGTVYTGVEILKPHYDESVRLKEIMGIKNVNFLHSDFRKLNMDDYDGFYIFNPFVIFMDRIDSTGEEEEKCEIAFRKLLADVKIGTKLVMYNPFCSEPEGFTYHSWINMSSAYRSYIKTK